MMKRSTLGTAQILAGTPGISPAHLHANRCTQCAAEQAQTKIAPKRKRGMLFKLVVDRDEMEDGKEPLHCSI
jgi:hypothetical protein